MMLKCRLEINADLPDKRESFATRKTAMHLHLRTVCELCTSCTHPCPMYAFAHARITFFLPESDLTFVSFLVAVFRMINRSRRRTLSGAVFL